MPSNGALNKNPSDTRAIVVMVALFTFGSALPISTINVALPTLATDLRMGAATLSWVPLIFILASVIWVLPCGRLADIHGKIRLFRSSIWLVLLSAVCAALAPNTPWLLFFRFLQGSAAAMGFVLLVSIVSSAVAMSVRGKAMGAIASAMYLGLTAGPLMAGYVVSYLNWRWTFLLHLPFMLAALTIGYFNVHSEWQNARGQAFDWKGALLYAISVSLVTVGIVGLPDVSNLLLIIIGGALLYWFIDTQKNTRYPLIRIALFKSNKRFLYSCIASIFMYAANFSALVLVSLHLQYLKGISAEQAGLILMVNPLTSAIVTPVAGAASDRFEPRSVATIGVLLTALGLALLASFTALSSVLLTIFTMIMLGIGFGFFAPVNAHAIMGSIEEQDYATGAAAHASVRLIGQLSSMAIVSVTFAVVIGRVQIVPTTYDALQTAISYCFIVATILCGPAGYYSLNRGRILS